MSDRYGNRRIVHLDKQGNFVKAWGTYGSRPGQFVLPHAIALGPKGNLYAGNLYGERAQKLVPITRRSTTKGLAH